MDRILDLHRQHTPQPSPATFLDRFPDSFVQYLDDGPARDPRKARCTPRFDPAEAGRKQRDGCGVYFSPNGFLAARRLECLRRIQAVFLDIDCARQGDGTGREEIETRKAAALLSLLSCPRPPHSITETRNGLQPVWRTEPPGVARGLRLFREAMEVLLRRFGGDPGAKDATRVLRLPGFLHLKDPSDPFLCRLLWDDGESEPRDLQSIIDDLHLPPPRPAPRPVSARAAVPRGPESDIAEVIRQAAHAAGVTVTFRGNADGSRQIVEDGVVTSGFISSRGNFCYSSSGKARKGGPVPLVQFYLGLDRADARRWLDERWTPPGGRPLRAHGRGPGQLSAAPDRPGALHADVQARAPEDRPDRLACGAGGAIGEPDPPSTGGIASPLTP
jgi:hypothetical protein